MKILYIILAVLFALFGYFQLNDEDFLIWVIGYGSVAVFFILAATGRFYPQWTARVGWLFLGAAIFLVPSLADFITNTDGMGLANGMSYDYPYIEESREFGGLLLAALAMLFLAGRATKHAKG